MSTQGHAALKLPLSRLNGFLRSFSQKHGFLHTFQAHISWRKPLPRAVEHTLVLKFAATSTDPPEKNAVNVDGITLTLSAFLSLIEHQILIYHKYLQTTQSSKAIH